MRLQESLAADIEHVDLVGVPYLRHGRSRAGMDCLGVLLHVYAAAGRSLPDPRPGCGAAALRQFRVLWDRAYGVLFERDVIHLRTHRERGLYTVLADPTWCITAERGVGVAVYRTREILSRHGAARYRLRAQGGRLAPLSPGILVVDDIFDAGSASHRLGGYGETVGDILEATHLDPADVVVVVNDEEVTDAARAVYPQDRVEICSIPADVGTILVSLLISAVISGVSYGVARATAPTPPERPRFSDSPVYGFDGIVNTVRPGTRIPIVYGTHRVGGHVISSAQRDPAVSEFIDAETATGVLHTLIAVCSGGRYGIHSITDIRVDRNSVLNFDSAVFSSRLGLAEQAPIAGFDDIPVQILKGDDLTVAGGAVTYTTQDEIDAYEVVIDFPQGLYKIDSRSGASQAHQVSITIEHSLTGAGVWTSIGAAAVRRKTQNPVRVYFESPRLQRAKYDVRITRVTADESGTKISRTEIFALTEITAEKLTYPGIALYSVRHLPTSQFSGRVPLYDGLVRGRLVKVFSAPGSFTVAHSRNPAWCLYDFLTEKEDALGAFIEESDIEIADFIDWAAFCDESIDIDSQGGTEPRCQLDLVIDGGQSAIEVIRQITSTGRAFLVLRGSKLGIVVDRDDPPAQLITMGRVRKGSFEVLKPTTQDQPTMFVGEFFNAANEYEADSLPVEDPNLASPDNIIETTLNLAGTTGMAQAQRLVGYHLLNSRLNRKEVECEVGVRNLRARAGDVVKVAHDVPQWGFSGRIRAVLADGAIIVLDRTVTIESGKTYELTVVHADDTIDVAVVSNPVGEASRLNITQGFTQTPYVGQDYSFGEVGQSTDLFRILSISRGSRPWRRRVSMRKHSPAVYGTDLTVLPDASPTALPDPRAIPPQVGNLRFAEHQAYQPDGSLENRILVSFSLPGVAGAWARVYWREHDATNPQMWEYAGEARIGSFVIRDDVRSPGVTYEISVTSCSTHGTCAQPASGARGFITTQGSTRQPPDVDGFRVDRTPDGLVFAWDAPADLDDAFDISHYEIRQGTNWGSALFVGRTGGRETELRVQKIAKSVAAASVSFLIKAVNLAGNYSQTADTVSIVIDGRVNENVIFTRQEDPTFGGTKVDCSVVSNELVFDDATGSYTTAKFQVASGDSVRCIISTAIDVEQVNKSYTWDAAEVTNETWDSQFAAVTTWSGADDTTARLRVEMRFSVLTDDDGDFGPWQERSQQFEANVVWAQVRILTEIDDPNFKLVVAKLCIFFDVPDLFDTGRETTVDTGSIAVAYNRTFHAEPNVTATVIDAIEGDTILIENKDIDGFDLSVLNGATDVIRTVEWEAIGY